jgi:hypothetical protein
MSRGITDDFAIDGRPVVLLSHARPRAMARRSSAVQVTSTRLLYRDLCENVAELAVTGQERAS